MIIRLRPRLGLGFSILANLGFDLSVDIDRVMFELKCTECQYNYAVQYEAEP